MAFYSPTWVRKLVKEDADNIAKYVSKKGNDFRDYIDRNTPFVLWLDISLIRERILNKSDEYIRDLAEAIQDDNNIDPDLSNKLKNLLDRTYKNTINAYANNPAYIRINQEELEEILVRLSTAEVGTIKTTISQYFKRTMVVDKVTIKDKSVMLILPKFTTLEFGNVFKKELKILVDQATWLEGPKKDNNNNNIPSWLGGLTPVDTTSQKYRLLLFVNSNFAKLQNIGHVEVDVISKKEKIVKRGQNSPRLLQALITLPNDIKAIERLQLKFSKETGQAETRVKIRKKFTKSKLIFELLIEHGLSVGIPETQKDNLVKAQLERSFNVGAGLTSSIIKNPNILSELETSKSLLKYVEETIINSLNGKPIKSYSSNTSIAQTSKVTINKVQSNLSKKAKNTSLTTISPLNKMAAAALQNLAGLQNLINMTLAQKIKENMGDGSRQDILNLRSARFAESAKVTRMSISREGMITAFYAYMKNPYQTFEPGFKQGAPNTRNPRLLISKSIRELAAEKVANRLRAVST